MTKPRHLFTAFALLLTVMVTTNSASAAFYTEGATEWAYRAPITVDNSSAPGSTIIMDVDLDDLIGQTTAPGTLDINSIRVVKDETLLISTQEFNDSVFAGASDATGNGQGEVRFILEDNSGTVDYHLYFDITANGSKPTNPAQVLNGTFEQGAGTPTGWTTSAQNAGGDQNNEIYNTGINTTLALAAGCSTSGATLDNSPSNNTIIATGNGWHLLGYRDRCEDGSGNELIQLNRNIRIPAGAASGTLDFSFQVQAFDGISNANNYDWFSIYINNTAIDHRNMGVVTGFPALVIDATRFGRSAFGTGMVDHGWRNATVNLGAYAGSTISLRFEARYSSADNAYRSWIKLDDVTWSAKQGKVGAPELDSASVATFLVGHDANGIYCLAEQFKVEAVDATGTQIQDFAGTITLDTQEGTGQFSLASGNGSFSSGSNGTASYTFVPLDQGAAAFFLNYPSGNSPIDIDVFLTGDATIRDDDSEGGLAFYPNGFTFTAAPLTNPPSSPINTTVPPQIAATDFRLYITAFGETEDDPTCGVIETYTGNKRLSFWQSFINPNSGTLRTTIDGTSIASSQALATDQNVSFLSGQARVVAQYPDAGEIRISANDSTTSSIAISGSTTNFVVKPAQLAISRIESSTGLANPGPTTLSGDRFVAAGEPFVVDVDALNANGALTPNFGREISSESVAVRSEALVLPTGGINGSAGDVQNGAVFTASPSSGRFTNTAVLFDETGIISLRARLIDDDYLGAGDIIRPTVARVGRFFPERFELTSGSVGPACVTFTYMDQPELDLSYEVQALNVAGDLTTNYSDDLYGAANTADLTLSAENDNNGIELSSRISALTSGWTSGRQSATTTVSFARDTTPDGPYSQLSIGARLTDSLDNQIIAGANILASSSGNCGAANTCNAIQIGGTTSVLYGRALVLPAQGPETSSLPIGIESQFFNGTEFQRNTADNCTRFSSVDAALAAYTDNLQVGETSVVSPASSTLFNAGSAPAANPLTLSAPGTGNTGTVDVTFLAPLWLDYDWTGTGDSDPSATATFGGFRGHDRVIYWQEQR